MAPRSFSDEDLFEGLSRLRAAIGAVDLRALEILACYSALERELDLTLDTLFPFPRHLSRLGFGHKVSVLQAACGHDVVNLIGPALVSFQDLRNCVAHSDKRTIDRASGKLCRSFELAKLDPKHTTVVGIATALTNMLTMLREEGTIG